MVKQGSMGGKPPPNAKPNPNPNNNNNNNSPNNANLVKQPSTGHMAGANRGQMPGGKPQPPRKDIAQNANAGGMMGLWFLFGCL
jgi:hypothetical protein